MKGKVYMNTSLIIKRDLYLNNSINGLLFLRKEFFSLHLLSRVSFWVQKNIKAMKFFHNLITMHNKTAIYKFINQFHSTYFLN